MEVLARVVTTGTSTSPLHDDGEIGVGSGNVDDLTNAVYGAGFERDVLDTRAPETVNDFDSLLGARNTSGNTETLDWETLATHFLPKGKLEGELTRVNVQGVEGKANTRSNETLDFSNLASERFGVVVSTTREFDVETGIESRTNETCLDCGGGHATDHDWRLAKKLREGGVKVEGTIAEVKIMLIASNEIAIERDEPSLNEVRSETFAPPNLLLDSLTKQLRGTLSLVTSNDNAYTASLEVSGRKRADTTDTPRTKIYSVSS